MTELQNTIPDHWLEVKLIDVISRISNGTTAKQNKEKIGLPVTRIETISKETVDLERVRHIANPSPEFISKYKLEKGDILFSHINSDLHLGKTAIFNLDLTVLHGMNLLLIRSNSDVIYPDYLNYLFKFFRYSGNFISIAQHAVNQSSINQRKMKQFKIPLAPYNEQVRIVDRVEELFSWLDAGVRSLQAAQTQLEQYRQTTLKQAYTGKTSGIKKDITTSIDELENLRKRTHDSVIDLRKRTRKRNYGKLDAIRYELLPDIPENWIWSRLEECVFVIDYRGKTPQFSEHGVPNIRSSNVKNGKIVWNGMKYITEETYEKWMTRGIPQEKDILFTTEAPLGDVAFVPKIKFSVAQRVIILRAMEKLIDPKFLFYQLMFPNFKDRLTGKGTGTTVTGVSYRNFRNLELVIPPISEQKQIESKIEEVISIIENIKISLNNSFLEIPKIKQSILKGAFEGRLVPQDPNDEPTSLLLKRIKAQKVKQRKSM
ncbi:restriction endonuclease subunit S [Candidatus Bathyarchaeota archaeon]|nr:restriction endonuclease subunit S [Candidatus Bathyarchaeota archaeon]